MRMAVYRCVSKGKTQSECGVRPGVEGEVAATDMIFHILNISPNTNIRNVQKRRHVHLDLHNQATCVRTLSLIRSLIVAWAMGQRAVGRRKRESGRDRESSCAVKQESKIRWSHHFFTIDIFCFCSAFVFKVEMFWMAEKKLQQCVCDMHVCKFFLSIGCKMQQKYINLAIYRIDAYWHDIHHVKCCGSCVKHIYKISMHTQLDEKGGSTFKRFKWISEERVAI